MKKFSFCWFSSSLFSRSIRGDGQDLLPAFLGKSAQGRANLVLEASGRRAFRADNWLLIPPYPGKPLNAEVNIETSLSPVPQLYDLRADPGQRTNLAAAQPAKLAEMQDAMKKAVGDYQANTQDLKLH